MKLIKGQKAGNNEERLANYFETGATFALFRRDLFSIRRLLVALISHLPKKDEEAFWQWYPAYGYRFPHYNTITDKQRRKVHESHEEWEVPFTSEDLPEGYFDERPEKKERETHSGSTDLHASCQANQQEDRVPVIPTRLRTSIEGRTRESDRGQLAQCSLELEITCARLLQLQGPP
eukprot:5629852-Amphidinium_carterae.1